MKIAPFDSLVWDSLRLAPNTFGFANQSLLKSQPNIMLHKISTGSFTNRSKLCLCIQHTCSCNKWYRQWEMVQTHTNTKHSPVNCLLLLLMPCEIGESLPLVSICRSKQSNVNINFISQITQSIDNIYFSCQVMRETFRRCLLQAGM